MKPSTSTSSRRRVSAEDALALWREYKATGDLQVRNRLVMTYAPLVKYIVFKKVRELPEWKKFSEEAAFNNTFMTGKQYADWVQNAETIHHGLMQEAGFLAAK